MISVIIPLYNKEPIIERTINSVLSQDYQDFEVIVVDDGSTDRSAEIVRNIKDHRIRLIEQENGGPSKARNTGVRHSKGEWIICLDADDELFPGSLKHLRHLADKYPSVEILGGNSVSYLNGEKHEHYPNGYKEGILEYPLIAHVISYYCLANGAAMYSRRIALACPFNESVRRYEDLECFLQMYHMSKVYISSYYIRKVNNDFSAASAPRKNINEDYLGHLNFNGKSLFEKIYIYRFFLSERLNYKEQCRLVNSKLYKRYDLLIMSKLFYYVTKILIFRKILIKNLYQKCSN